MATLSTNHFRFEWGVVLVGTVLALAISIVLMQFGSAIGFSYGETLDMDASKASWQFIAIGLWLLWVQLIASVCGGYAAGYLKSPTADYKPYENELHDGLYGLSVWATSTVVVFVGLAFAATINTFVSLEAGTYETPSALTDTQQNTGIAYAFAAGASSLVSALAAWWAATMGGDHRLKGTDFSAFYTFRK